MTSGVLQYAHEDHRDDPTNSDVWRYSPLLMSADSPKVTVMTRNGFLETEAMTERYSRKDAQAAFARLASALGKTWSDEHGNLYSGNYYEPVPAGVLWTRDLDNRAHVGAWVLDHNGVYGGYVIEEMHNEGGGVSQPFGSMRRSARDFCYAVNFALNAIAEHDKVTA